MKPHILPMLAMLAATSMATTQAQSATFACGGSPPAPPPTITPTFATTAADRTNLGFECMMWQNFIYLNWPALNNQRGVPNSQAKFGAPARPCGRPTRPSSRPSCPAAATPAPGTVSPC